MTTTRKIAARRIAGLWIVGCLLLTSQQAQAQSFLSEAPDQASTDLSTPAMKYFGRGMHTQVTRPRARRQALPMQRFQLAGGKPFQNVNRGPSVTPYLQLDMIEGSGGVPNYYSRILPLMQQQQANQAQALQLRRLQQQIRTANAPGSRTNSRNGGVPTTGHSSQFLNNGGYFPTLQR